MTRPRPSWSGFFYINAVCPFRPRICRDTLHSHRAPLHPTWVAPHKWAVGTTFEWEFDFPVSTNPAYQPKPGSKRKTKKPANPKVAPTAARKTSKPATSQTAKPKASKKPKRVRLTPEERQERARARAAEKRLMLKQSGLCKDCRQPAIPGQNRCSTCAEKHRKSRRPRQSKGNEMSRASPEQSHEATPDATSEPSLAHERVTR